MKLMKELYRPQWEIENAKSYFFQDSFYLKKEEEKHFWVIRLQEKEKIKKEELKKIINRIENELQNIEKMIFPILIAENGYEELSEYKNLNIRFETKDYLDTLQEYQKQQRFYYELLPHNQQAVDKIIHLWKDDRKVAVIQPTGSGKTFLMLQIMEWFKGEEKLILAPNKFILEQTQKSNVNEWLTTKYMTYQKTLYLNIEEKKELKRLDPKLIILDEFHRVGAESWEKGVHELLNDFPNAYILGVTATPIRYLDEERDMTKELFNNHIAQQIDLAEAITRKILPMPKYITSLYEVGESLEEKIKDIKSKKPFKGQKQLIEEIKSFRTKWKKTQDVSKIFEKHLNESHQKFIIFFKNKKHMEKMREEIVTWFHNWNEKKKIKLYLVTSDQKPNENQKSLKEFEKEKRDEISILFAIDILNEGVHLPKVDALVLLRNTVSPNIYLQQIGRIITPFASKNTVIFDLVNNIENIQTVSFIRQLKQVNDEENKYRERIGLMKQDISFRIFDETLGMQQFVEEIEIRINTQFEERMEELKEFYSHYGHSNVPDNWQENRKLATWTRSLRSRFKQSNLTNYEIKQLKRVEFQFDLYEYRWYQGYEMIKQYYQQYGHSRVPQNEKFQKEANWVAVQRRNKKAGKLSDEKVKLLENLQFIWDVNEEIFEQRLHELEEYYQQQGHSHITESYWNKALYSFTRKLRGKKNQLSQQVLERLKKIDFIWNIQEAKWDTQYQQLKEFYEKNGEANVPQSFHGKGEVSLGNWVIQQRKKKKTGKLSTDKIEKLDKLGFIWEIKP